MHIQMLFEPDDDSASRMLIWCDECTTPLFRDKDAVPFVVFGVPARNDDPCTTVHIACCEACRDALLRVVYQGDGQSQDSEMEMARAAWMPFQHFFWWIRKDALMEGGIDVGDTAMFASMDAAMAGMATATEDASHG